MTSEPKKRSLTVAGHATSVSLEEPFWDALVEVAEARGQSIASLVAEIDTGRGTSGLSSAVRTYLLEYFRRRSAASVSSRNPEADRAR